MTRPLRQAATEPVDTAVRDRVGNRVGRRLPSPGATLRFTLWHPIYGKVVIRPRSELGIVRIVEKLPKTKDEIQRLIIAELRTCEECENAWGIIVVPVLDDLGIATWTVSRFHRGQSDAYACDRALQRIVPHYQRLYDLAQIH